MRLMHASRLIEGVSALNCSFNIKFVVFVATHAWPAGASVLIESKVPSFGRAILKPSDASGSYFQWINHLISCVSSSLLIYSDVRQRSLAINFLVLSTTRRLDANSCCHHACSGLFDIDHTRGWPQERTARSRSSERNKSRTPEIGTRLQSKPPSAACSRQVSVASTKLATNRKSGIGTKGQLALSVVWI